jgi:hypothetical protein
MTSALDHLNQVSIFSSALALFVLVGFNWAFTLIHILQEWKGESAPLWRVFGAVVGTWIPNWFGFLLFTVVLTVLQWTVGLVAIAGWLPICGPVALPTTICALGVLLGMRITDSIVSHWVLYSRGYRPNPGLSSTALYSIEVVFILATFCKGLSLNHGAAWAGFTTGALFFTLVLPLLRLLSAVRPGWRRDPWKPGEPLPSWATA